MFEQRRNIRYPTLARVRIPDVFKGEAFLKDLSITGCCIECTMHIDIQIKFPYKIEVLPETASAIDKFDLSVESCWIRAGGYSREIGFLITASPKGKLFQRYVDYLVWRSAAV
jgi:hypothetical protein